MCGRYDFLADDSFYARFQVADKADLPVNYNVTPGTVMPVITRNSPNRVRFMQWGLVPSWAHDPKVGYRMINAVAETLADRPAYRKPFRTQRCLVPASGFYEWKREGKNKLPFLFRDESEQYISFAGLYDVWKSPTGAELETYTIVTTRANGTVGEVHPRMPAILTREGEEVWLSHDSTLSELHAALSPYERNTFVGYPVSPRVNNPANNDAELTQPFSQTNSS